MVNVQRCYSDPDLILAQFIWERLCPRGGQYGIDPSNRDVQLDDGKRIFSGADGNLDWVVPDKEQAKAAVDGIPLFDTVLFGRRTYELFEKFWKHASSTTPPQRRTLTIAENGQKNTAP